MKEGPGSSANSDPLTFHHNHVCVFVGDGGDFMMVLNCGKACPMLATILKQIEYGVYKEYVRVLSKIIFYLLQDGCNFLILGHHV